MKTRDELAVRHPMQPTFTDENGTLRFKGNAIVDHLAEGKLNDLACMNFSCEDWVQFSQLIGYSVDGLGTLSYVSAEEASVADLVIDGEGEAQARIRVLENELAKLRKAAREAIAGLAELIPED